MTLPDRIGLMSSLWKLDIANNNINKLPLTFGALNQMQRVDLECNHLEILPENLNNLLSCHTLVLNNRLHRLLRGIGACPLYLPVSHAQHDHVHPTGAG